MSRSVLLLSAALLLAAVATASAAAGPPPKPGPLKANMLGKAVLNVVKPTEADKDNGPTPPELKKMSVTWKAAAAKAKPLVKKMPAQARFAELNANVPNPYQLWVESRAYIQRVVPGADLNNQWGIVGWYSNNAGANPWANFLRASAPTAPQGNQHSEQILHAAGWFNPPNNMGVTDVVLYSSFSPCHARQDGHGQGCMLDVIVPVAQALCQRGIHFTVIFSGRYTAQGSYKWDDVWNAWIARPQLVAQALNGCFSMYQINLGLIKRAKTKEMVTYFDGSGKGPRHDDIKPWVK